MVRFYTPNLDEACDALDLYDIDYDLEALPILWCLP